MSNKVLELYETLLAHYGDLHWWLAKTPYKENSIILFIFAADFDFRGLKRHFTKYSKKLVIMARK